MRSWFICCTALELEFARTRELAVWSVATAHLEVEEFVVKREQSGT